MEKMDVKRLTSTHVTFQLRSQLSKVQRIVIGFRNQGLFGTDNPQSSMTTAIVVAVAALTAGAAFMMWLGEQITEKGVGNGISIILLINIVARIPNDLSNLYQNYVAKPTDVTSKIIAAVIILAIIVAMFVFIVFLQDGERRIPVQYAKRFRDIKYPVDSPATFL